MDSASPDGPAARREGRWLLRLIDGAARVAARSCYRVWQFLRGVRPHLAPHEVALVRAALSDAEIALFVASEGRDRRHAVDLHHLLVREGERDGRPPSPALLVAALLHDVGKGRLRTWHRVLFVLLEAVSPRLARRVEAVHGAGWRRALWRLRHHARLGAEELRAAGSDPRVIEIVAAHTGAPPPGDAEVRRFMDADDRV